MYNRIPKFNVVSVTMLILIALGGIGYLLRYNDQASEERIKSAPSPYTKQAAKDLVKWEPWQESTFINAKKQAKMIFLDIGRWSCNESELMSRDIYREPAIADILNQDFIAIKVDADNRPDIYERYRFLFQKYNPNKTIRTPIIAVLDYNGTPIWITDRLSLLDLKDQITRLQNSWRTDRDSLMNDSEDNIRIVNSDILIQPKAEKLPVDWQDNFQLIIKKAIDPVTGLLYNNITTDISVPILIEYLLIQYERENNSDAGKLAQIILNGYLNSRFHDPIFGGFYSGSCNNFNAKNNYSKNLDENALWLKAYSLGYASFKNPDYLQVSYEILDLLQTQFWNSQERAYSTSIKGSKSVENPGAPYLWSENEIQTALSPQELSLSYNYYMLVDTGLPGQGRQIQISNSISNVALLMRQDEDSVRQNIQNIRTKLNQAHQMNMPPNDGAVYSRFNSVAIDSLITAYRVFNDNKFREPAITVLNTLRKHWLDENGAVVHSTIKKEFCPTQWVENQFVFTKATLSVFSATGEPSLLKISEKCLDKAVLTNWNAATGGFSDIPSTCKDECGFLFTILPFRDHSSPALNPLAVDVMNCYASFTNQSIWDDRADLTLMAGAGSRNDYGISACSWSLALYRHQKPLPLIILVGDAKNIKYKQLAEQLFEIHPLVANVIMTRNEYVFGSITPASDPKVIIKIENNPNMEFTDPFILSDYLNNKL